MFKRICKIIFVRHGSTIYTEQNRLYDIEDYPPLNEKGKEEMQKASNWLKINSPNIDKIYTSSSLRSIQSARIIAKNCKTDFEITDNLFERKAGIWGGLTFDQIEKKYPDMLNQYHKNPCSFWPDGGESTIEVISRTKKIIDDIVNSNYQKRIVVITHEGVIQSAVSLALGVTPENQTKIYAPTGSITQISYFTEWASLVYSGFIPN
ncbi:MAG: histidine phosphatase family protein [Candidatus Gastranaerophilales bacterium]|nr:histidine phosphatase family protein [Candidatus Gastranaerophilales bacterium]